MLTVSSLNLWGDDYKKSERIENLLKLCKASKSDIYLFQENSEFPGSQKSTSKIIADELGYNIVECEGYFSPAILYRDGYIKGGVLDLSNNVNLSEINTSSKFQYLPYLVFDRGCHRVLISSIHLPWGPREDVRLKTAYEIDILLREIGNEQKVDAIVIGGDFNSQPSSDTLRFFEGMKVYNNYSTLWSNSTKLLGYGEYFTSRRENKYAQIVAQSVGFTNLEEIPNRVIDYQFSFGYTYGKIGHPLELDIIKNSEHDVSDHEGFTIKYRC